jgi:hypothetical protein
LKDFLGKELKVGDTVVHCGGRYKNLSRGVVEKITLKTLLIRTQHQANLGREIFTASSDQVILLYNEAQKETK